jgi:hypothetical protein
MGYRRSYSNRRNNNYAVDGGYDSTGRWRSEAWHMDGGANDEGWHQAWCSFCGKKTEHGRQSTGTFCVPCDNQARTVRRSKPKNNTDVSNPHKRDRWATIKMYEARAQSMPAFLKSLEKQNQERSLSPNQVAIGAKVLSSIIDQDIIDRLWTKTSPQSSDWQMQVGTIVRLNSAVNPMTVLKIDNNRAEVLLECLASGNKSWARNDGRWVLIK